MARAQAEDMIQDILNDVPLPDPRALSTQAKSADWKSKKIYVGIDDPPPSFSVMGKLLGPKVRPRRETLNPESQALVDLSIHGTDVGAEVHFDLEPKKPSFAKSATRVLERRKDP